jgi:hypothetical protein
MVVAMAVTRHFKIEKIVAESSNDYGTIVP